MEKLPPQEKVYEAWSALADGRVEPAGPGRWLVGSSDGAKRYEVLRDGDTYRSNDSATYWQGYAGYPVLAVLMREGRLPYDEEAARWFAGVDWHALNAAAKRDYAAALGEAVRERGLGASQVEQAEKAASLVMDALRGLGVAVGRNGHRPQKG